MAPRQGDDSERIVTVGRIAGVFGVRGWLKVYSETEPRENIIDYDPWYLHRDGQWQSHHVDGGRSHGKGVVAKLRGLDDRETAALLVGSDVGIRRSQFANDLAEGEYYWADLEGLQVVTIAGVNLGEIDHLIATGANDVMVVTGDRERLIPYLPGRVVMRVDLKMHQVQVDWDPDF